MPVNYQNGKIYKLVNSENNILYVGSTAQPYLSSRMGSHRRCSTLPERNEPLYQAMRAIGVDKFQIILLHAFPCNSKSELEAEEFKTMQLLSDKGIDLYNVSRNANGKQAESTLKKRRGAGNGTFNYGGVRYCVQRGVSYWLFSTGAGQQGKRLDQYFSVKKLGFWKAYAMAEAARKLKYPDYKGFDEIIIEDFMHIEWE